MEAIKYYVKGAFLGIAETPEVLEQQEELIADLSAKLDDLVAEGRSQEEALGMAIASMGDLSALVREFATEEPTASATPVEPPVPTFEVYSSKLRLHVMLLSVGGAIAVLFVLSVVAAFGGALRAQAGVWDLFLGVAAIALIGNALVRFHERPNAIEIVEMPGRDRLQKAVMQWAVGCVLTLFANAALGNGEVWAWTVWIATAAWPAHVLVEQRLLQSGKFLHARETGAEPAAHGACVPGKAVEASA